MENLCKRGCLSPPEVCHIPSAGWRWGRLVPPRARLQGAGAGEVLSLLQQWYTSSMNVVCTWLTDRMDLQLHIYQLKTLIRIVKVTPAVLSWASCCWKGHVCVRCVLMGSGGRQKMQSFVQMLKNEETYRMDKQELEMHAKHAWKWAQGNCLHEKRENSAIQPYLYKKHTETAAHMG